VAILYCNRTCFIQQGKL